MADWDPGPPWIRDDFPQPIAIAWDAALGTLASPDGPDPQRFVAAVEAALRYLAGIQLAALRAAEAPLPELLRGGAFRQPTLGFWFLLAKNLRDAPPNLLTPELGDWPDPFIDGTLAELINLRGRLRFEPGDGPPNPEQRRLTARIVPLAVEVMRSLAPLRAPKLLMVVAQRAIDAFRHDGAIQVFHGPGLQPPAERARWRGQLVNFALVLAPSSAAANRREAIHLAPFVTFERLRDAQADSVCLWRGMNERTQVLVHGDPEDPRAWRALESGTLLWPFQRDEPESGPREAAFPQRLRHVDGAPGPLEPPTMRGAPLARAPEPRLSAWPTGGTASPVAAAPAPSRGLRLAGLILGAALALAATTWFALRIASDLEVAPAPSAAPAPPSTPSAASPRLAAAPPAAPSTPPGTLTSGVWELEAQILVSGPATSPAGARRSAPSPLPVAYRLQLQRMADAATLEGTLTRKPPSPPPQRQTTRRPAPGTTPASGPVIPVGPTPGGSWVMRTGLKGEGRNELIELGIRVRRTPFGLIGLWRHEGAERTRGALAGVLTGAPEGTPLPAVSPCLATCLADCADTVPAADPAAEGCLETCLAPARCPAVAPSP